MVVVPTVRLAASEDVLVINASLLAHKARVLVCGERERARESKPKKSNACEQRQTENDQTKWQQPPQQHRKAEHQWKKNGRVKLEARRGEKEEKHKEEETTKNKKEEAERRTRHCCDLLVINLQRRCCTQSTASPWQWQSCLT